MVQARSRSRHTTSNASSSSVSATVDDDVDSVRSNIPTTSLSSLSHACSEQRWRQRTVRLTRHATAEQSADAAISRQRLDTSDRYLTLTCRQHPSRTREYIVRSDAPLLSTVDYVVVAITAVAIGWLALLGRGWCSELHVAVAVLPLALTALSKLQTVKEGTHTLTHAPTRSHRCLRDR